MNSDISDCEEELLVYVEFKDNVDIENYKSIHVLGADGNRPIVQMDDMFFTGKYENPLGTYMFFEDDPNPQCEDSLFDKVPEKNLKYFCKTRKCLQVEHAYVTPKEGRDPNQPNQAVQPGDVIEPITFKTVKEAVDKFKESFNSTAVTTSTNEPTENVMDVCENQNMNP
ncbi:general transcription factor 3C polypeptide 6 isoform X3 [Manduca sexta]|uniref:Transcription factor TFIIIC triple barrel domain-containing protein n=1 Tax=Manduca sexta TaxID=7130 RepID=A0A921ZW54_MANSE|nr:general transcription factor 3C polypeptide 6 isoform X3 [Manduca sexta]KAG6464363.1 hypothetical protein O3G_MSEX014464 [Manduca sexta]